jgi:hypothetical protein
MGTVAASILKIRRLVNDNTSPYVFSDDMIARLFWRAEVAFLVETKLLVSVTELDEVLVWDYMTSELWEASHAGGATTYVGADYTATVDEYGLAGGKRIVCFQEAMFPFEVEGSTALTTGGVLLTSGFETLHTTDDPVMMLPYFLPRDCIAVLHAAFDGVTLTQGEIEELERIYLDVGKTLAGDPRSFAIKDLSSREFFTDRIPTSNSSRVLLVVTEQSTSQEVSTLQESAIYVPFEKFAEFKAASVLLAAETEKRNEIKSAHFEARFAIGVNLGKNIRSKLNTKAMKVLGQGIGSRGRRPWPRLPDHYPALRVR